METFVCGKRENLEMRKPVNLTCSFAMNFVWEGGQTLTKLYVKNFLHTNNNDLGRKCVSGERISKIEKMNRNVDY